jgi:uncharacterized membrane protein (UPF0182 family)
MQSPYGQNGNRGRQRPLDVDDMKLPPWAVTTIKWSLAAIALIFLIVLLSWLRRVYTNWLWFEDVGYLDLYRKILWTKVWLFFVSAGLFALIAAPSLYVAFRLTRNETPPTLTPQAYQVVKRALVWASVAVVSVAALVFGLVASGRWETVLLFMNPSTFVSMDPTTGQGAELTEPILNMGVGFYVFKLPMLGFIRGWMLGAMVTAMVLTVIYYMVVFGLREKNLAIPRDVKLHGAILAALVFVTIAAGHWLGRYELLYAHNGAVFGVGYTDDNARLPVRTIMAFVALLSGGLMVAGAFMSGYRLMVGAVGLWIGMAILVGGLFPYLIQKFQVDPNELTKERDYLANNISLTRQAYGINLQPEQVREHGGLEVVDADIIEANRGTINNVRLWDEVPLAQIYNQTEFVQFFYEFVRIGVDRYKFNNETVQVMLSTRELAVDKLETQDQTWTNRHIVYTHGHGAAVSAVNDVGPNGQPKMLMSNIPPVSAAGFEELDLTEPSIYFGLKSEAYVLVGTKLQELDYKVEGGGEVFTEYDGLGGVRINSLIKRLAYAWQFADVNILISGEIEGSRTRIQYRRTVPERVRILAPFLRLDGDPYQVLEDGRLFFIQDAYTTSSHFPYSEPWQPRDFNYIRNSVKAVVDAYNGTVDFYVYDPNDPIIQSYSKMFPGVFKSKDEMPAYLQEHVRYPRDMFIVQSRMFLRYHVDDPGTYYQGSDRWSIPRQNSFGREGNLEAYYIYGRLPDEPEEEFLLIQPFTPERRDPLKAWLAVRNDGDHYGQMILYRFPEARSILGPNQVEARIDNDAAISQQFTLWGQVGAEVQRGEMLVIPVGDAILYAEPIFLKPRNLPFPELRRIILADGQKVVMHPTLEDSVRALKGEIQAVAPAVAEDGGPQPGTPTPGIIPTPTPGGTGTPGPTIPPEGVTLTPEELEALINALRELGLRVEELERILQDLTERQ